MRTFVIKNVKIVTPTEVIDSGSLLVSDGKIEKIYKAEPINLNGIEVIEGNGQWLLPGLIDLHDDAIEKEVEPRPHAYFPMDTAFYSLENRLVTSGVTTIFHSLSFAEGELGIRAADKVVSIIQHIHRLKSQGLIRHFIHARYEITDHKSHKIIEELLERGQVQLLSFMDHTPGQGQFRKLEAYESFLKKTYRMDEEEVSRLLQHKKEAKELHSAQYVNALSNIANKYRIPMASHDDDTCEKVQLMSEKGVSISEFPINLETAKYAAKKDLYVMVGAPNIMRGVSTSGNLTAIDAITGQAANILCSDYLPSSILHAIFILVQKYGISMNEAVNMASLNPARAVHKDKELGSIECGKRADLVLIDQFGQIPLVKQVFVNGMKVLETNRKEFSKETVI
jgi:alpha-D-ribose 1-methylphosphonate 5-triphosphate diphosphatase